MQSNIIPLHPALVQGQLSCGIKYKLLHCPLPKKSVELRLLVGVGSLEEEEEERGFAHFVEHLGFKGTKSWDRQSLVNYLQSLGSSWGADLNAATSFLDTKFRLVLGFDETTFRSRFGLGLDILCEWASSMNISKNDVEEEKQIILAEFRSKQGLSQRLVKKYWSAVFGSESKSNNRFPIGLPEVFLNCTHEQLREFYTKHYRPENMTILIVGDVGDRVEEICSILDDQIVEFGGCSISSVPKTTFSIPDFHTEDEIICLYDQELTTSSVTVEFFKPIQPASTEDFVTSDVMARLMVSILDRRLDNLAKGFGQTDEAAIAPFISGGLSIREFVRGLSCVGMTATLKQTDSAGSVEESIRCALKALLLEMRRISELGIHEEELASAKERWRNAFKEKMNADSRIEASTLANDLESHVLGDCKSVFTTQREEATICLSCLESVTLEMITSFLSLLDMHLSEAHSQRHYRAGVPGCFRVLWVQLPPQKPILSTPPSTTALAEDAIDSAALRRLLAELRTEVAAAPLLQWAKPPRIFAEDVICAAQVLLAEKNETSLISPPKSGSALVGDSTCTAAFGQCGENCGCSPFNFLPAAFLKQQRRSDGVLKAAESSTAFTTPPSVTSAAVERDMPTAEALDVRLANGVNICLKWMKDHSPNRVSMQAFAFGGSSELTEAEETVFSMLDEVGCRSGFAAGDSEPESGERLLCGRNIDDLQSRTKTRVNTQRHTYHRGIGGSSQSDTVELMLALLTLKMNAQIISPEELLKSVKVESEQMEHRENSPEFVFMERARIVCCGDEHIFRPLNKTKLAEVNPLSGQPLYDRAFMADPTAFTFVFVGDLPSKDVIIPLIDRYVGRFAPNQELLRSRGQWVRPQPALAVPLPPSRSSVALAASTEAESEIESAVAQLSLDGSTNELALSTAVTSHSPTSSTMVSTTSRSPFTRLGTNFVFPQYPVRETMRKRVSDKTSTLMVFRADLPDADTDDLIVCFALDVACRVLQLRLLDVLRIRLGKVYSVSVEKSRNSLSPFSMVSVVTECDQDDLEQVHNAIDDEIRSLQSVGPEESAVAGILETMLLMHARSLVNSSYWLFWCLDSYKAYGLHRLRVGEDAVQEGLAATARAAWVDGAIVTRSTGRVNLLREHITPARVQGVFQTFFSLQRSVRLSLQPLLPPPSLRAPTDKDKEPSEAGEAEPESKLEAPSTPLVQSSS